MITTLYLWLSWIATPISYFIYSSLPITFFTLSLGSRNTLHGGPCPNFSFILLLFTEISKNNYIAQMRDFRSRSHSFRHRIINSFINVVVRGRCTKPATCWSTYSMKTWHPPSSFFLFFYCLFFLSSLFPFSLLNFLLFFSFISSA